MRTLIKSCFAASTNYHKEPGDDAKASLQKLSNQAFSKIDKAVKRGVIHRNLGAHQKSRLSSAIKKALEPNYQK